MTTSLEQARSGWADDVRTILFLGADAAYLHDFRAPLMRLFRERGDRVVAVAALRNGFDPAAFDALGVEFHEWRMHKASLNPLADIGPLLDLRRMLARIAPDVLFAHTVKPVIYGLVLARLAGVPRRTAMIPGLGYAFADAPGMKRRMVGAVATLGYRAALSGAQMVIFQNPDDRSTMHRAGALPERIPTGLVDGSGVDMTRFVPAPWPSGPPRFLMLSRLLKDKGVFEYVEAARIVRREFPDARFVLAGGTDPNPAAVPQAQIDAWVNEGLIEAPGHVSDPRGAFADCHVFVLPSFYREGCPRVNLEAMAMGRAVVTTDWVGCRETVIDGVNGLMVPPRDGRALGEALLTLARDLPRARAMGEAGRELCRERFELDAVARATAALISGEAA